jgi:uncharacterized repeat protein (TIGR03803 family)
MKTKSLFAGIALVFLGALTGSNIAAAQTESVLFSFDGTDGAHPQSELVADKAGNLYGTTYTGGASENGTVFELSPPQQPGGAWTETVLHAFTAQSDGQWPDGGVTFDQDGNLFGTTVSGGAGATQTYYGTIFELSPNGNGGWIYTQIASFDKGPTPQIQEPCCKLIVDSTGNLYGVSEGGIYNFLICGIYPCGNVYELIRPRQAGGTWIPKVLYNFLYSSTTDGFGPPGINWGPDGAIYGTTANGGTYEMGTLFKLTPSAKGRWKETILYNFVPPQGYPTHNLIWGPNGSLYGTSGNGYGTVFQMVPPSGSNKTWTQNILYNFTNGEDGAGPYGVIADGAGNLYGVTIQGANSAQYCLSNQAGAVWELKPQSGGGWQEVTLYDFKGGEENDGCNPSWPPLLLNGVLYGMTAYGGSSNQAGSVFTLTP